MCVLSTRLRKGKQFLSRGGKVPVKYVLNTCAARLPTFCKGVYFEMACLSSFFLPQHCGINSFENDGGGKVGEAIYVGTALDQVDDGKVSESWYQHGLVVRIYLVGSHLLK